MADIVVQDNQITTVVETGSGDAIVTTSGTTDVVSTNVPTTILVSQTGVEVVEAAGDIVVTPQEATTVVEVAPSGSSAYPWNVFRNSIASGEVCTVPVGSFLLGVESFLIAGSLDNEGRVLIL